jgi:hypothetical protein
MPVEPDGNGYARQRLGQAVTCLVGEGRLRVRLTHAAYHLVLLRDDLVAAQSVFFNRREGQFHRRRTDERAPHDP